MRKAALLRKARGGHTQCHLSLSGGQSGWTAVVAHAMYEEPAELCHQGAPHRPHVDSNPALCLLDCVAACQCRVPMLFCCRCCCFCCCRLLLCQCSTAALPGTERVMTSLAAAPLEEGRTEQTLRQQADNSRTQLVLVAIKSQQLLLTGGCSPAAPHSN